MIVMDRSHITKNSVYDYLVLAMKKDRGCKLAGLITEKQLVMQIARGDMDLHWSMITKVCQKAFPMRGYEPGNLYEGAIEIFSFGYDFHFSIPDRISYQQYETVLDIVSQIHKFERDYRTKLAYFDEKKIMEEARSKVSGSYLFESDERIVGTPIDNQKIFKSINLDVNLESCESASDVYEAAKKILKYYRDDFFKDSIMEICPSVDRIDEIITKSRMIELFGDKDFEVHNVSFDNIVEILENYYEINKKSIIHGKLDENSQDLVYSSLDSLYEKKLNDFSYDHYISEVVYYLRLSNKHLVDYKRARDYYYEALKSGDEFEIVLSKGLLNISFEYDRLFFIEHFNGLRKEIRGSELSKEQKEELVHLIDSQLNSYNEWESSEDLVIDESKKVV